MLAADVARRVDASGWGAVAAHIPLESDAKRWAELAIPNLAPDRFGSYLTAAWSSVRAAHFFWPWFDARAANAVPFAPADVAPQALALEHRSLIRGRAGRALMSTLLAADRDALVAAAPAIVIWEKAPWAQARAEVWSPKHR